MHNMYVYTNNNNSGFLRILHVSPMLLTKVKCYSKLNLNQWFKEDGEVAWEEIMSSSLKLHHVSAQLLSSFKGKQWHIRENNGPQQQISHRS